MNVIGLTGTNAAGKGEVANYLKNQGYAYFSLSDAIRDELKKEDIDEICEIIANHHNPGKVNTQNFKILVLFRKIR